MKLLRAVAIEIAVPDRDEQLGARWRVSARDLVERDHRQSAERALSQEVPVDGKGDRRIEAIVAEVEMGDLGEQARAEDDERSYRSVALGRSGRLFMQHFLLAEMR